MSFWDGDAYLDFTADCFDHKENTAVVVSAAGYTDLIFTVAPSAGVKITFTGADRASYLNAISQVQVGQNNFRRNKIT